MDQDTAKHVGEISTWLYNHAASLWLILSATGGAVIWALHQRFATRAAVEKARIENEAQHYRIEEKIDRNHVELLNTIINLHSEKK